MRVRGFLLFASMLALIAAAQETPAPEFTEAIEVRVIDVDVVVTDRQGNRIMTLAREDFELTEDGKPVEIAYFSRVVDGLSSEEAAAGPTGAPAARAPLTWVIYLDQTNLPPSRRNVALRQLRTFFERSLPQGDQALFASNDGMSMRVRQNLTGDRKLLLETLAAVEKDRVHRGAASTQANFIRNELRAADPADAQFSFIGANLARQIGSVIQEEGRRTRNALNAYNALVGAMAGLPGRVALLYVGAGFNTLPGLDLTEAWKARFGGMGIEGPQPEDERQWLEKEVSTLYEHLSATRIAVYTIHGSESRGPSVEDPGTTTALDGGVFGDRAGLIEAGLAREMADRTGGLYFAINTALASKLDAVRNDVSNYYSLGYRPTGKPGEGRRVRVRARTPGARVRHRETVREPTRQARAAAAVVAATLQPTRVRVVARAPVPMPSVPLLPSESNPLGVSVQAQRPQRDGWTLDHRLPFDFAVRLETLTFQQRGGALRADFVIHFAMAGADGTIWPLESRQHSLQIPQSQAPGDGENVNYSWHVDLAPLKVPAGVPVNAAGMKLLVTVEDRTSGLRSVITSALPGRER